jgi:hypothetical protein
VDYFFLYPQSYWTSNSCFFDTSRAWIVNFANGTTSCLDKGGQGQNQFKLRTLLVRDLE